MRYVVIIERVKTICQEFLVTMFIVKILKMAKPAYDYSTFEESKLSLLRYLRELQLCPSSVRPCLNKTDVKRLLYVHFSATGAHFYHRFIKDITSYREERATDFIFDFLYRLGQDNCLVAKWVTENPCAEDCPSLILRKFIGNLNMYVTRGADKKIAFIEEILD